MAALARELGAVLIVTDQCWAFPWTDGAAGERATCDGSQKPTGLLVSRELASAASYLSRRCADLPPHTHANPMSFRTLSLRSVPHYVSPLSGHAILCSQGKWGRGALPSLLCTGGDCP